MYKRVGTEHRIIPKGSVCVQYMITVREGGMGVCSLLSIPLLPGFSGLVVGIFQSLSMPQENAIRSNCSGSIVEQESLLTIMMNNCNCIMDHQ